MNARILVLICLLVLPLSSLIADTTFTDISNRSITLDEKIERFVISEGRYITALALLRPENPVKGLVGMVSPLNWTNPLLEEQLFQKFPRARDIALYGGQDESSVSVEKILELNPQLAIFGIQDHGPGAKNKEMIEQLESAGVKVVFIDFRMDPLGNTETSIEILGKVLSAEENAQRYLELYRSRLQRITDDVEAHVKYRPSVFLQAHAGRMDCCRAMADGMLGPFIEVVGGENIADAVAPGPTSLHTAEFLLVQDPDVWIGTASGTYAEYKEGKTPVALGGGMTPEMAEHSLEKFLKTPEFSALSAVSNGRAHAIWHNFYNSPLNIVAVEAFAKWIQPELFSDINPQETLETIYHDHMQFDVTGTYSVTAVAKQDD